MDLLPLSVVIISYNEESVIHSCLLSVAFAQEILLMDSNSSDNTCQIVQDLQQQWKNDGPQVHIHHCDWPGDGPQRNRGIQKASSEWVLCLDADERVSPLLHQELIHFFQQPPPHAGYHIPFQSYYLGKRIRYGDWRREQHLRFFQKESGHYSESLVYGAQGAHCRPLLKHGTTGRFQHLIEHYPYRSIDMILEKMHRYSTGGAILKKAQGLKSSLSKALLHGLWTFVRGYIIKRGFLDGSRGFLLAVANAECCYYRYIKLAFMTESVDAQR
jgi:glycosyltransferase involved in cell wall biosynthesis